MMAKKKLQSELKYQSQFGNLLTTLRCKLDLDMLGPQRMCWASNEVELKRMTCWSISRYEVGHSLPRPGRAAALARVLESPLLFQLHREERKPPVAYWWRARIGLIPEMSEVMSKVRQPLTEEHRQAISRTKKGRSLPEAIHRAALRANTGRLMPETTRQALLRSRIGNSMPEASRQAQIQAVSIQDEFIDQGTPQWRYEQRRKRDAQAARLEQEKAMLEERARLAAQRAPWSPPEEGWDLAEAWE